MPEQQKKSGFVVLVGRSNVGKSTLLNALVGSKVAIVTPKAQTTRQSVRGILSEERGQIVFVDTPGLFLGKSDTLSKRLTQSVHAALEGVELVVYVVDPTRAPGAEEENLQRLLRKLPIPIVLAINKSDLPDPRKPFLEQARSTHIEQRTTLEISALKRHDLNRLTDAIFALLPTGPAFYPEGQLTDLGHEPWLAELIREKAFLHLSQELPYSLDVRITDMAERDAGTRYIAATIVTNQERYKKMIIGQGGKMLQRIGSDARKELEAVTGKRIYLELHVEIDPRWQHRL